MICQKLPVKREFKGNTFLCVFAKHTFFFWYNCTDVCKAKFHCSCVLKSRPKVSDSLAEGQLWSQLHWSQHSSGVPCSFHFAVKGTELYKLFNDLLCWQESRASERQKSFDSFGTFVKISHWKQRLSWKIDGVCSGERFYHDRGISNYLLFQIFKKRIHWMWMILHWKGVSLRQLNCLSFFTKKEKFISHQLGDLNDKYLMAGAATNVETMSHISAVKPACTISWEQLFYPVVIKL